MRRSFLDSSVLGREPYSAILAYPRASPRQISSRLAELKTLGVGRVAFWGPVRLGRLDVLGKGYTGVVILGRYNNRTVAVKIRRTDARRPTMSGESRILQQANRAGVGPRLVAHSRNFLVMQYVKGRYISDWISDCDSAYLVKQMLAKVVTDCYKLDLAGIDHGELGRITKHVIVGRAPVLVDFESSSINRRPANVTSAVQCIFISAQMAKLASAMYDLPSKRRIIGALRQYKHEISHQNYRHLMQVLGLDNHADTYRNAIPTS